MQNRAQIRALAQALLEQTDDAALESPLLLDVCERYRTEQLANGTWKSSSRAIADDLIRELSAELGMRPMDSIGPDDARELLMRWGRTPIARRRLELLARLRRHAIAAGESVGPDPLQGIRLPVLRRRERYLQLAEVARLGAALDADQREGLTTQSCARAIRGIVLVGLRVSEMAQLRWSEVDLHDGVIRLRDSKVGERIVPLGEDAVVFFRRMVRVGTCVCAGRGQWSDRPITTSGVRQALARASKRAGLEGVMPHVLRHTWATTAYHAGVPLQTIQVVLGHSTAAQTAEYLHVSIQLSQPGATLTAAKLASALTGGVA